VIQRIANVFAAAGQIDNIVAGRSIEFASDDSVLSVAAAVSAGIGTINVRLTDEVVVDDSTVAVAAEPIWPDHALCVRQPMARGDHLLIRITASAAGTFRTLIDVQPI
jgi:hypothetical protein